MPKTSKKTTKGGLLDSPPKAMGKVIEKDRRKIKKRCPVHHCDGYRTDWTPPHGIDPLMREYRCPVGGHGFYEIDKANDESIT